jgi:hypothetical protein
MGVMKSPHHLGYSRGFSATEPRPRPGLSGFSATPRVILHRLAAALGAAADKALNMTIARDLQSRLIRKHRLMKDGRDLKTTEESVFRDDDGGLVGYAIGAALQAAIR